MQRGEYQSSDETNWQSLVLTNVNQSVTTRESIRDNIWRCPHCQQQIIPKLGTRNAWHFAHAINVQTECLIYSDNEYNPERQEHIAMKSTMVAWAQRQYPQAKITMEHRIAKIGRIADVFIEEPDLQIAVECQYSAIDLDSLAARTNSYEQNKIEVLWVLPHNGDINGTINWLRSKKLPYIIAELEAQYAATQI